jgi:hypothetical protein
MRTDNYLAQMATPHVHYPRPRPVQRPASNSEARKRAERKAAA